MTRGQRVLLWIGAVALLIFGVFWLVALIQTNVGYPEVGRFLVSIVVLVFAPLAGGFVLAFLALRR